MERCQLPLDQKALSIGQANNTLIITVCYDNVPIAIYCLIMCFMCSTRSHPSSLSWRKLSKRFTVKLRQPKMGTLTVIRVNDVRVNVVIMYFILMLMSCVICVVTLTFLNIEDYRKNN